MMCGWNVVGMFFSSVDICVMLFCGLWMWKVKNGNDFSIFEIIVVFLLINGLDESRKNGVFGVILVF